MINNLDLKPTDPRTSTVVTYTFNIHIRSIFYLLLKAISFRKWNRKHFESICTFLIEYKTESNDLAVKWQHCASGWTRGGRFPLDLQTHIGSAPALLTVSKKPQTCKYIYKKAQKDGTWSSHVIIQSARAKKFPASFLLSSYTTEKNMAVIFICLIPIFVLHEKKLSFQSLILAKQSLPVFRHIKTLKEYENYVGQQQHLEDGNQRKTLSIKQKHLWKFVLFWNSSHLSVSLHLLSPKTTKTWVRMCWRD